MQRTLRNSANTPVEGEYTGVIDATKQIYKNEGGVSAFYAGLLQDTGKSIADSFLFFLCYNYLRQNRLGKHGPRTTTLPVVDELALGAVAGAFSKFFTTPIANVVTRKQTAHMVAARSPLSSSSEPSVKDIIEQIQSEKGSQGFWSGYSASLVLTLNPSLTFFLYETFKRTLLPRSKRDDPGAGVTFLMAAVSKAIASTITYPFSLAKARAQISPKRPIDREVVDDIKAEAEAAVKGKDAGKAGKVSCDTSHILARSTVFTTVFNIYRDQGFAALYEGVLGEILKGFFSHGTTMLVKEAVHKVIIQLYLTILKLLSRAPTSADVLDQAKLTAGQAGESVSSAYAQAGETVNGAYDKARETAGSLAQNVSDATREAYVRAQVIGGNTVEVIKSGNEKNK